MKFRNKKKEDKKLSKEYSFKVTVADPIGETIREINTFRAKKVRNKDNNIVELENEKEVFREFYPLDYEQDFDFDIDYCEKQINKLKTTQKSLKKSTNELNVKAQLYKWNKIKTALSTKGGSFVKYDQDGTPHFLFLRYKSVFIPMKWNIRTGHIHVPNEPNIKDVIKAKEEKQIKYKQNKLNYMQTVLMIGFIILIIGFGIQVFFFSKLANQVNESSVAKLQERIDNTPLICAEYVGQTASNWKEASDKAVSNENKISDILDKLQQTTITQTNNDLIENTEPIAIN